MSADGCGSDDDALSDNGSYVCVGRCKWGKGGTDTFELLCMLSRIVDSKQ